MVVDERSRHEMYRRLDEVLGEEAANTLIEHLPPVGWADVATKHDLAALEERLELRFDRIDDRFGRVDDRFARMEDRFARVDDQFDRIDERLGAMGDRFGALDDKLDKRFEKLDERFGKYDERLLRTKFELQATFEKALRSQTLTVMFGLITVVMTMAALAFALMRFT